MVRGDLFSASSERRNDSARLRRLPTVPAELAAVPKLVHPNIAEMIDFGVAGSQGYTLYVAYEWVGGRSLRGLLDANARQSLGAAREILSPIAAALDYAHSQAASL